MVSLRILAAGYGRHSKSEADVEMTMTDLAATAFPRTTGKQVRPDG
jgi:hypothetical protein